MKLKPYVEALANTKEQNEADMAPSRAKETQKRIELKQAELESQILMTETAIDTLSRQYPLNVDQLTAHSDKLALLTRMHSQLAEILKQMFPVEAA